MSKKNILSILSILLLFVVACSDESEVDTEKPVIDISFSGAFPVNCDTLYFGEPFVMKMKFSDNVELGAYSINIHNNFDHHSHSTEVTACNPDPDKDPVNPYVSIDDYSIPEGSMEYETNLTVSIPEDDGTAWYDDGDYHFFISLTDKEGWSAQKGLSIKILHR
ncbi:DUF4625 domain-containing protein [uncultured Draconibacterium sp.]|uniref:DUF4625 domain-containing protein n=1 Tax=uncultured Draconibacterium sp. TaxID=1573823 RepID=UPI0029C99629|nr:DUF4625 domain-containing protein [uncultured Draconibacterium sp.]